MSIEKARKEKASQNLLYFGIVSIVMLFAGLISAYVVSAGDLFWLKTKMPFSFWLSTAIILVSSVTINLALVYAKKNNKGLIKIFVSLTLILGMGFSFFQYRGWGEMVDKGLFMVGNIMYGKGIYGKYFHIEENGVPIEYKAGKYFKGEKELEGEELQRLIDYTGSIVKNEGLEDSRFDGYSLYYEEQRLDYGEGTFYYPKHEVDNFNKEAIRQLCLRLSNPEIDSVSIEMSEARKLYRVTFEGKDLVVADHKILADSVPLSESRMSEAKSLLELFADGIDKKDLDSVYGEKIVFSYRNGELTYKDGALYTPDIGIDKVEQIRLNNFAEKINVQQGDFYAKGEYGEDFQIYYKGIPVEYIEGEFYVNDEKLTAAEMDYLNTSRDNATAFLYVLSFLHLLHLLGGLIYLIAVVIKAFREEFNEDNHLKIKLAGIYWHFLDGLWVFLFLFLYLFH